MERKTIGKFIAVLRKASGMTQRELGERLFVSDKTVSRWECDECTPELSLIPAIAEIFGVTADELLRGERKSHETAEDSSPQTEARQRAKGEKQMRLMLHNRVRRYRNLTLIGLGLSLLGLIAALVTNLAFTEAFIAFCLATAFILAGEICQVCFAANARLLTDEEDTYSAEIQNANTSVTRTAVLMSFINLGLFAFCLPLGVSLVEIGDFANISLRFKYWLGYGAAAVTAVLVAAWLIYALFVRKYLQNKGLICVDEQERERDNRARALLVKLLTVSVCIALVIGIGIVALNMAGLKYLLRKDVFNTSGELKEYMETQYDEWYGEQHFYYDSEGNELVGTGDYYPKKVYETLKNSEGEVICEFYYNPDLYRSIELTSASEDGMPVTVITNEAYREAMGAFSDISSILYFLMGLDFAVAGAVYVYKTHISYYRARRRSC